MIRRNDVEKLYIQHEDLCLIRDKFSSIKLSSKTKSLLDSDNKRNKYNTFLCVTDKKDIEIINTINSILDYRNIRSYSKSVLENEIKLLRRKKMDSDLKRHMITQLKEMINIKNNASKLELPLAIDYMGINYTGTNDSTYIVSTGIDPNTFFFYRQDNKVLSIVDDIPDNFIETAIAINKIARSKQDEVIIDYNEEHFTSIDNKYLITRITDTKTLSKYDRFVKVLKNNK